LGFTWDVCHRDPEHFDSGRQKKSILALVAFALYKARVRAIVEFDYRYSGEIWSAHYEIRYELAKAIRDRLSASSIAASDYQKLRQGNLCQDDMPRKRTHKTGVQQLLWSAQ
jgi:hypothetical protein